MTRVKKLFKMKTGKHEIDAEGDKGQGLEELKKCDEEEISQDLSDIKAILQKIPDEEIVKSIRESRDQRSVVSPSK